MRYLPKIQPQYYAQLLAAENPQNFSEAVENGKRSIDRSCRTILIGLGGMGVRTIDRIKADLAARFTPDWQSRLAFLAVDTDHIDLSRVRHLAPWETMHISHSGPHRDPDTFPPAWTAIADADTIRPFVNMPFDGCGGRRLRGRLLLHSQSPRGGGFDEQVVAHLHRILDSLEPPLSNLNVYVIGSLFGGTASGMFLDFPALIRHALRPYQPDIHAIFYLSDSGIPVPQDQARQFHANTYAALKELDYYQHLCSRDGYSEKFPYSSPEQPVLELNSSEGMFQSVQLVSASMGPTNDPIRTAVDSVCAHILSMVEASTVSFPPMMPAHWMLYRPHSEDGRRCFYRTIGISRAELPRDILRSYLIGKLCSTSGLFSVSAEERASQLAGGVSRLPFLGEDQYESAAAIKRHAAQLLHPLRELMWQCLTLSFSFEAVFGQGPNWEELRTGIAENPAIHQRTYAEIECQTSSDALHRLEKQMSECFIQFRETVQSYVGEYGPMAFCNLFHGRGLPDASGEQPCGILERLNMLRDGLAPDTGVPFNWPGTNEARDNLDRITDEIVRLHNKSRIVILLRPNLRTELCSRWIHAYDAWVNTQIHEIHLRMMLGQGGILARHFLEPACLLVEQLYAFGKVIEAMSSAYRAHGTALNDFTAFRNMSITENTVNIGGLFPQIHHALHSHMDMLALQFDPFALRRRLIQDFFEDSHRWMDVDHRNIQSWSGQITLTDPNSPIAARLAFDRCVNDVLPQLTLSIRDLFHMSQNHGISEQQFAQMLLHELAQKNRPLLRAAFAVDPVFELIYPHEIQNAEPILATALQNAAQALFPNVSFRLSCDSDAISLHQIHAPFEISRLSELPAWERAYEGEVNHRTGGIHGYSPDVHRIMPWTRNDSIRYEEQIPWSKYPGLVLRHNPMAPDPFTDRIRMDGQNMLEINQLLDEARVFGVLYAKLESSGWSIYRVYLDNQAEWEFYPNLLRLYPDTHHMPTGHKLLLYILDQNRVLLDDVSRRVCMDNCGPLFDVQLTEKDAWAQAYRVLWYHRPMLAEIRDMVKCIHIWHEVGV